MSHPQEGEWKRKCNFVGYHPAVERIRNVLLFAKGEYNSEQQSGNPLNRGGALIVGPSGVGKTLLCRSLSEAEFGKRDGGVLFIDCTSLIPRLQTLQTVPSGEIGQSERMIFSFFDSRESIAAPCVIILDQVDAICPARGASRRKTGRSGISQPTQARINSALLEALDTRSPGVCVLATAPNVLDVDPSLVQNGRLHNIVELKPPEEHDRLDILTLYTSSMDIDHQVLRSIARRTKGLLGCDLEHICREAATTAVSEALAVNPDIDSVSISTISAENFERAMHLCRPLAAVCNGSIIFTPSVPHVSLSSVIGCEAQIEALRTAILLPLKYPHVFESRGARWTGVLLHGPTGCGKTLSALAIAHEAVSKGLVRFISVPCTSIIDKVVGRTEATLAAAFSVARDYAPTILFLDHIECLGAKRGYHSSTEQTFNRLLSILLVEMDGTHRNSSSSSPVVVVAATQDPFLLDPALTRPGRLSCHVAFHAPGAEDRARLFDYYTSCMPLRLNEEEEEQLDVLGNGDELENCVLTKPPSIREWFIHTTEGLGFTAADVEHICRESAMEALREEIDSNTVCRRHFERALKSIV